ncbi:amino acid adenylation domain-containing protein [Streptomyces sp. NPDC046853]|uniref:amino acid adenylation domain-containing protein n=1 Tax=Streptomyces sp. NPDC046853 TaxID=3154920 RepID=UPI003403B2DB
MHPHHVPIAPLSRAQERLWYVDAASPDTAAYHVPLLTRWHERVDVPALSAALEAVVTRHEVLRTTYGLHEGRPVQFVHPPAPVPIDVVTDKVPEPAELSRRSRVPFDLTAAPPVRCTVWKNGTGPDTMLLTFHHIAIDGWSLAPLYEDLSSAYEQALLGGPVRLSEPPAPYTEFASREAETLADPGVTAELGARVAQLLPALGEVVLDFAPALPARRPEEEREGAEHQFRLTADTARDVSQLAARVHATPFTVLFAAFQAVVQRWTQRQDFVVSTVAANRLDPGLGTSVGLFANTVPLICRPDPRTTFEESCAAARVEAFGVHTHQRLPFDLLAAEVAARAPGTYAGLSDLGFILQNAPLPQPHSACRWDPPVLLPTGTAKRDVSFVLEYDTDGIAGTVEYDVHRCTPATARAFAESFAALLEAALRAPDTRLHELPVARGASSVIRGPGHGTAGHRNVVAAFESRIAQAPPHAPAVSCAGTVLSWRELDAWSAAVARHLGSLGAGRGSFVPVLCSRGGPLIAAWTGVLRCGAAFVPLALDTPAARLEFVLRQAEATAVLVDEAGARLLSTLDAAVTPVRLDEIRDGSPVGDGRAPADPEGSDPAVLIYTSGTTGNPKGVLVPHRGLLNTALWWADDCGLGPDDRLLLTAGTGFDPAPFNALQALLAGALLVIADDTDRRDAHALLRHLRGPEGVTVAGSLTPTLLQAMLDTDTDATPTTLRVVYAGGESLPHRLAAACARQWETEVRNVYGVTEASCNSTCARVDPAADGAPPIGVPLPGTYLQVLGPLGEELPPGVPGELHVGGVGVALGYLKRPELTAAAFRPDPFAAAPGALLCRTGDVVRQRPDGQLEYLGRVDDQAKILGHRVDPREVRGLLEEHPAVGAAVVHAEAGGTRLVAYVEVADTAGPLPTREDVVGPLRRWLAPAVLPTEVYAVASLPRTANDKTDLVALAGMRDRPLAAATAPATALTDAQKRAAALMARWLTEARKDTTLTGDGLGPDSDFFTSGGHSLLAVRMLAAAEQEWGRPVPLRSFLAAPTVAGLARCLTEDDDALVSRGPVHIDEHGLHPATAIQRRLWLIDRLAALRAAYLAPSVVEFTGPVDRALLSAAFAAVLARHPALRSRFRLDARRRQVFFHTDGAPGHVRRVDARGLSHQQVEQLVAEVCWTPFDLAADAPARGAVITLSDHRTLLVYGVHHIVSDGWSLGIVMDQIAAVYRAMAGHVVPELPAPVHPAALTTLPSETDTQSRLAELAGAPTDIDLPHNRPRGTVQDVTADSCALLLPAETARRLREAGGVLGCTAFMTLTALVATALARRGDQQDFLFAFPWSGREAPGSGAAVGMFVNTLVVRADATGNPTWRELLTRVRTSAMAAYRYADTSFDTLASCLHPGRDLSRPPVTPVFIDATTDPPHVPCLGAAVTARFLEPPRPKGKYELEFHAADTPGGLELTLSYATALFDLSTARTLLAEVAGAARDLTADLEASVFDISPPPQDLASEVAAAWSDVLDEPCVAHDVNFFDAGGDSLLLVLLVERLAPLARRGVDAADLFEHSTVTAQAAFLAAQDTPPPPGSAESTPRTTDRSRLLGRSPRPVVVGIEGEPGE